jgi:glycosyltransferase involved in cell wall biosynthesis
MNALYGLADVLLFPSLKEGFGLCVLEAMAAGAAVVVPREEPFTEYLDARSATFVDPCSTEDIALGLADLLADPVMRATLVREARHRARSYTWSHSASLHLAHYDALLQRGALEDRAHA